jgi:phospholipid/cholesterol/gamma-HCH transport system ATP-binding protein
MEENIPGIPPIIRTEHLAKSFGDHAVLRDVSLVIPEDSVFSVIGQSGTGKSVLFKSIIGMLRPDSGHVWFRNRELTAMSSEELLGLRKSFGYAFQNAALFDSLTVAENIAFPLRETLHIRDKAEIARKVAKILEWIELPGIQSKLPDELSGGMRKRVGVARALIMQPEVLFFDEPTTGLDPALSETICNLVLRVNKEMHITCVMITHDIPQAFRISSRVAVLDQGRVVADGTPSEVARSDYPLVRDFMRIAFDEQRPGTET